MTIITYTVGIDRADDGTYSHNITSDLITLTWRLGLEQPDHHTSQLSWARLTVNNASRAYSPDSTDDLIGHSARITATIDATTITLFTGTVHAITPQTGTYSQQRAEILLAGHETRLQQPIREFIPQTDVRSDDAVLAILQAVASPPVRAGYAILDMPAHNLLDSIMLYGDETPASVRQIGKAVLTDFGEITPERNAAVILRDIARAEQGALVVDRDGVFRFFNRHHRLIGDTLMSFSDDMTGLNMVVGDDRVNRARVTIQPRSVGLNGTVLTQLATSQPLLPGSVKRMTATYRSADGQPVTTRAIESLQVTVTTAVNGGIDRTQRVGVTIVRQTPSSLTLDIHNPTNQVLYLTQLTVTGQPVSAGDSLTVEHQNPYSQARYGDHLREVDVPLLSDAEEAQALAVYLVERGQAMGAVVRSIEISLNQHTDALNLSLFDRIHISDSQTGHSADYLIVSEHHTVTVGGTVHTVRYDLQPADSLPYHRLDISWIDSPTEQIAPF